MPKFYIKWEMDSAKIPDDPKEQAKSWIAMLQMVKADMQAGMVKDWGLAAGGGSGYAIREEASEADVFTAMLKWMPYVQFEVVPVLTADQALDAIKKATAKA